MGNMLVLKTDEDKRLVFGLASVSSLADGVEYVDRQGDVIKSEDLEAAVYDYVAESREADSMHNRKPAATLVESFYVTREKLEGLFKALGIDGVDLSKVAPSAAWVGYRVDDNAVWKRVKDGELRAFSIEATAERVEA
jgi:hypothetical protein